MIVIGFNFNEEAKCIAIMTLKNLQCEFVAVPRLRECVTENFVEIILGRLN